MVRDSHAGEASGRHAGETNGRLVGWSRRNVLRVTGAVAGVAAGGGAGVAGAAEGGSATDGNATASHGDGPRRDEHLIENEIDPVFGYPIAADGIGDMDLAHVVELRVEEGQGAHADFPQEPDPEAPGQFVEVPAEFVFDPVGVHVRPCDLVHFTNAAGLHTVTAFHEKFTEPNLDVPTRVPDGVPGFTSPPITAGEAWVYQFRTRGVYDVFCFPHLGLGMVMRLVVFDPDEDDLEDDAFSAPSTGELFPNVDRVLSARELDPANIVDAGAVAWADLTLDSGQSG